MAICFEIKKPKIISFNIEALKRLTFVVPPYVVVSKETEIESLSVTSNGTYTAPEGKAYNPVTVNVPIPSNYGLITYNGYELTVS